MERILLSALESFERRRPLHSCVARVGLLESGWPCVSCDGGPAQLPPGLGAALHAAEQEMHAAAAADANAAAAAAMASAAAAGEWAREACGLVASLLVVVHAAVSAAIETSELAAAGAACAARECAFEPAPTAVGPATATLPPAKWYDPPPAASAAAGTSVAHVWEPHIKRRRYFLMPPAPVKQRVAGRSIVYWTDCTLRVRDNLALHVACVLARRLRMPLSVYATLPAACRSGSAGGHSLPPLARGPSRAARWRASALAALTTALWQRHVPLIVLAVDESDEAAAAAQLFRAMHAHIVLSDESLLPHRAAVQRAAAAALHAAPRLPLYAVDSENIEPIRYANAHLPSSSDATIALAEYEAMLIRDGGAPVDAAMKALGAGRAPHALDLAVQAPAWAQHTARARAYIPMALRAQWQHAIVDSSHLVCLARGINVQPECACSAADATPSGGENAASAALDSLVQHLKLRGCAGIAAEVATSDEGACFGCCHIGGATRSATAATAQRSSVAALLPYIALGSLSAPRVLQVMQLKLGATMAEEPRKALLRIIASRRERAVCVLHARAARAASTSPPAKRARLEARAPHACASGAAAAASASAAVATPCGDAAYAWSSLFASSEATAAATARGRAKQLLVFPADLEQGRSRNVRWNAVQLRLVRSGQIHFRKITFWAKHVRACSADAATALSWVLSALRRHALGGVHAEARLLVLEALRGG